jgi:outer membrane protein TolC
VSRRGRWLGLFVGALGLLRSAVALADPLPLAAVLASIDRHYPLIEAARRDKQAAAAELLSAQGAFDPLVRTRMDGAPLGYYQNGRFDLSVEVPTPLWGATVNGGYRAAFGKFADYDGKLETNQYGELRASLALPILRNGPIDRRRAAIERAQLGLPLADTGVKQARIDAARAGAVRYWEWVAAGQRLRVAESLLQLATARDLATEERVRRGDVAQIDRVDNLRTVVGRRGGMVAANRSLQAAAFELSIYLRDERGQPLVADPSQLPAQLPPPAATPVEGVALGASAATADALKRRPEVERLRLAREQLRVDRDLAKNQALPAIDLVASVSQDFGPGDPSRTPTVIEGGLSIELPTANRAARGRRQVAEAAMGRVEAQSRFAADRISIEVSDTLSAMAAAQERLALAAEEVRLSRQVEVAERTRFGLGDSNVLFVNLREQATVEAALREIDAGLDYHRAHAAYRAAIAAD